MEPEDKIYLISNLDIYAEIIDKKVMNNTLHYNIVVHRGTSKTKSCLSKVGLETFYQRSPIAKKNSLIIKYKINIHPTKMSIGLESHSSSKKKQALSVIDYDKFIVNKIN